MTEQLNQRGRTLPEFIVYIILIIETVLAIM